jgi:hypothetical protein
MGMKRDRGLIELARGKLSVEQIATKLKITPKLAFMMGRRLGIYFPPLKAKPNGRRKARR